MAGHSICDIDRFLKGIWLSEEINNVVRALVVWYPKEDCTNNQNTAWQI